ncbi:hypothetical protein [Nonomuraea typhae]|uniref:Tn3 transposase DDE domain-containing protein n=1 Tax=Nonomuraea typhae TaxID=2603600 RepID=A0ABW7YPJ2_9ACTN
MAQHSGVLAGAGGCDAEVASDIAGRAPVGGRFQDGGAAIAAEGRAVDPDDLAAISPYITHVIRRFGNWILNLTLPSTDPTTQLDLESRVLFAPDEPKQTVCHT